jgi:hypothetical protein
LEWWLGSAMWGRRGRENWFILLKLQPMVYINITWLKEGNTQHSVSLACSPAKEP